MGDRLEANPAGRSSTTQGNSELRLPVPDSPGKKSPGLLQYNAPMDDLRQNPQP